MYGLWPEAWLRLHARERDERSRAIAPLVPRPTAAPASPTTAPAPLVGRDLACC